MVNNDFVSAVSLCSSIDKRSVDADSDQVCVCVYICIKCFLQFSYLKAYAKINCRYSVWGEVV